MFKGFMKVQRTLSCVNDDTCDICERRRCQGSHKRCSKIRQARYRAQGGKQ